MDENIINVDELGIKSHIYDDEWVMALMQRGVIVNLTVGYWRGSVALDHDTLGIKFANNTRDFVNNYIKLGTCKVFPPGLLNEISKVAREAKENLAAHSFKTIWGDFVPYRAFPSWEEKNNIIKERFMGYSEKIACEYHEIVRDVKEDYSSLACDVWQRLNPHSKVINDSFVNNFVNGIEEKIPDRDKIISSFKYDVTYYVIPLPSFLADDIAQKIKKEQLTEYEIALEKETKRKIATCYIEQKRNLIDGFLNSTVIYLRKYIYDICNSVLESVKNKEKSDLTTANLKKINDMVEKVNMLNLFDDEEISSHIRDLEYIVNKYYGHHNSEKIITKLVDIKNIAKSSFSENYNPTFDNVNIDEI